MKNIKLSLMMFLQYMMLPIWFVPMLPYVQSLSGGESWVFWCGLIMGFGTFSSPLFGMFADRFFNAERVLAFCNFAGSILLSVAFFAQSAPSVFVLMLLTMFFYMPTWSLSATIAMANAPENTYPRFRVFGTIGWVASGAFSLLGAKVFGIDDFDTSRWIFASASVVSFVGGVIALLLPHTAPTQKGSRLSIADALGLKALVLLKDKRFLSFVVVTILAMIPFQWYNVYCAAYLKESGFKYLTLTINLGQVGEMFFMLLVSIIISRLGYRGAMCIGLGALAFRNLSFAISSFFKLSQFDFGAILVHGLIFGLFIVGAQMFVAENAPKELRNQAQGLMNLITAGVGVFASNFVFHFVLGANYRWTLAYVTALIISLVGMLAASILLQGRKGKGA